MRNRRVTIHSRAEHLLCGFGQTHSTGIVFRSIAKHRKLPAGIVFRSIAQEWIMTGAKLLVYRAGMDNDWSEVTISGQTELFGNGRF